MFSKPQGSQTQGSGLGVNVTGGQLSNVQIGGVAGGDISLSGFQYIEQDSTGRPLTSADVTDLLSEIQLIISQTAALQEAEKNKTILSVDIVRDEVQSNEPDKEHVAKSLNRITKALKDADATVEAGTGLWENVKPIVEAIKPWLGLAAGFVV